MRRILHGKSGVKTASVKVVLATLLLLPAATFAVQLEDIYSVVVAVDTEAEDPRLAAMQAAMGKLLVRLTGQRGVAGDPRVMPLLDAADRYVQQWGFQTADDMIVTFDGPAVENEIRRLNLPLWGAERPSTLLWVVFDSGGRRLLLGAEQEEGPDRLDFLREMIADTAAERGLPLVLPLLDAEDMAAVSAADVWGGFNDQIEAASRRYDADAILIGRLRSTGSAVAARWTLLTGDEFRERRGTVRDGIDWLADNYARQYAVTGSAQRRRILVSEVRGFDDYGRLMAFMEQLSLVESLAVEEVVADTVLLSMQIRGDDQVLRRALTLGSVLQPIPPPLSSQAGIADAYFRVAP